jgi:hypothetical protein
MTSFLSNIVSNSYVFSVIIYERKIFEYAYFVQDDAPLEPTSDIRANGDGL